MNEYLLANAIIEKNCEDYIEAIKRENLHDVNECEKFFKSDWYKELTNVDGEWLQLNLLKKEILDLFNKNKELSRRNKTLTNRIAELKKAK